MSIAAKEKPGLTLVDQIRAAVHEQISAGILSRGARIPSVRRAADIYKVSKSTVVEAYDRLATEGVIRARPGSGFVVDGQNAPLPLADLAPKLDRAIDPFWVSRQSLEASGELLLPGCGWLPSSWMPTDILQKGLRRLARRPDTALTDYATPLGLAALRQLLTTRLHDQSISVSPDQIVLTESGTQAIDLICRLVVKPGDCVLVDDPCYFNFLALLRAHQVTIVAVPMTETGPDLDEFARLVSLHQPRLYLTNSGFHNPTGVRLTANAAHQLLRLCEAGNVTIVEDDIFADFESDPATRLAALDGLRQVIRIGSFSKTLSASVRCGYVAASLPMVEALVNLKIATSFAGGQMAAELVLGALQDGSYRRHVAGLRARLAKVQVQVLKNLAALDIRPWIVPQGGIFIWARLPADIAAAELARRAYRRDVVLAPGNVFSLSQSAGQFMRFNIAQSTDPRLFDLLAELIEEMRRGA